MLNTVANLLRDLNATSTRTNLRHALALEVNAMLRPDGRVIHLALKVAEALNRRRIMSRGEANTRDEPPTGDFTPIRAVDAPLVGLLVEACPVYMLVVLDVLFHAPLFLDVFEVASELLPTGVAFLKGKVFPELLIEELVNWSIAVDTSAGVAVPVLWRSAISPGCAGCGSNTYPDAAAGAAFLVDADTQPLFPESIEESERCETSTDQKDIDVWNLWLAH